MYSNVCVVRGGRAGALLPRNARPVDQADLHRLRGQYHYGPSGDGHDGWNVVRLSEWPRRFRSSTSRSTIWARSTPTNWFEAMHKPTVRNVVHHVKDAKHEGDLALPVILGPDNPVMDGMHHIVRALLGDPTHVRHDNERRDP